MTHPTAQSDLTRLLSRLRLAYGFRRAGGRRTLRAVVGVDLEGALDRYEAAVQEIEAEREAKRQAEAEAEAAAKPTTAIVREAITGASAPVALNGMGVLRAALSGMGTKGTINGQSE
jgi:hypothetical protein